MERNKRYKKKGHGCLFGGIVFVIVAIAIFCVLFFMTDVMKGARHKLYGLFYPQKYTAEVEAYSKEFGVEEDLVYAVIHTESRFRPDAESHAGAIGLMQLMPDTFTWLQENLDGEIRYAQSELKDPAINIRYGTYLLSYLIDLYGDVGTAVAAYNAGVANVDRWLSDSAYSQDGKTLSDIPYEETRNYVQKVFRALEMYDTIYK